MSLLLVGSVEYSQQLFMLYLSPESVNRFQAPQETICCSSLCPQSVLALHSAIWYIKLSHIPDPIWWIWPQGWKTPSSLAGMRKWAEEIEATCTRSKGIKTTQKSKLLALLIQSMIVKTMILISSFPHYKTECFQIIPTNFEPGLWKKYLQYRGGFSQKEVHWTGQN